MHSYCNICTAIHSHFTLGDLTTVIKRKEKSVQTNQISTYLLNEWPKTIAKTMAAAIKFIKFS